MNAPVLGRTVDDMAPDAEPGKTYPAWRDGRRIGTKGPTLHAVTDEWAGAPMQSGFLALCGRSVKFKVLDEFDVDDDQSCLECVAALLVANRGAA